MDLNKLIDLDVSRGIDIIANSNIALWGGKDKGKYVLSMLKQSSLKNNIIGIYDSDCTLWNSEIEGEVIKCPDILYSKKITNLVVVLCVAPSSYLDIDDKLAANIKDYNILTYFGIINMFRKHFDNLFYEKNIKNIFIEEKKEGIKKNHNVRQMIYDIREIKDGDVLVCHPGKVGSTSIYFGLKKNGLRIFTNGTFYGKFVSGYVLPGDKDKYGDELNRLKQLRLKIIVGVREPISRDISAFFQTYTEDNKVARGDWLFETGDFQEMFKIFMKHILRDDICKTIDMYVGTWRNEFMWLKTDFYKLFDIDVYEYPFNREKGYQIIQKGNKDIFIYKMEYLDLLSDEIYRFATDKNEGTLLCENNGSVKWYNLAYKKFKQDVVLDKEYVDYYYKDNPMMDHFYTEEEKKCFLDKWYNNIGVR
jgi:hypothetical protein